MTEVEIDIRDFPRSRRHPEIFERFQQLEVGHSLIVLSHPVPERLREDFDHELPGSFIWESLGECAETWKVRITKLTRTPLPRQVGTTATGDPAEITSAAGSIWQLTPAARDMDANVIALGAEDLIDTHDGPELDVLIHVVAGNGTLSTEAGDIQLEPGAIVWLPRRSQRRFTAGPAGLRYLSVHHRKPALNIMTGPQRDD